MAEGSPIRLSLQMRGLANALLCDFDALDLASPARRGFDLLIGGDDVAQVAAEQILVEAERPAGVIAPVPQTAGIRGDLVGEQQRCCRKCGPFRS